jgi:hypothetical protein
MSSITEKILDGYHERGLLYKQKHPNLPLTIWNYTEKVQYEGLWDEITLSCRGLITEDTTGKVIIQPFKKFFNYEELVGDRMKGFSIPKKGDYVYVQEKVDGSLGILFFYGDQWIMATRGSFTSDQAIKGLEIFKEKHFPPAFLSEFAYLVEIIYPENRVVIKYNGEKLVFLSVVLNWDFSGWKESEHNELHWTTANDIFKSIGIKKKDIVKSDQYFSFSDELYQNLKAKNEDNKEGFVLRYQPDNFRMKIKFEEYVRLHKIMTNLSTTAVWGILSNGRRMEDMLKDVPDEFYVKIKEYQDHLLNEYTEILHSHLAKVSSTLRYYRPSRKEMAERFKEEKEYNISILFDIADGKNPSVKIWRILKPEFRKL